jgi:hypothetical protein
MHVAAAAAALGNLLAAAAAAAAAADLRLTHPPALLPSWLPAMHGPPAAAGQQTTVSIVVQPTYFVTKMVAPNNESIALT